ncbi:hypothetical protein DRO69_00540 [Candidatus Bathyarchaeota archaeon]|nr:MAG: hypothetical protein DRO69_00540 [Candidatus Bathyarchaeota archaeon]
MFGAKKDLNSKSFTDKKYRGFFVFRLVVEVFAFDDGKVTVRCDLQRDDRSVDYWYWYGAVDAKAALKELKNFVDKKFTFMEGMVLQNVKKEENKG